jgi:primosomal protein N''
MADGSIIFLIVFTTVVVYGIVDSCHYTFIRRKLTIKRDDIRQRITEANIKVGEYTQRLVEDPQYEEHIEEVHQEIDALVEQLTACEQKCSNHKDIFMSIGSWLGSKP